MDHKEEKELDQSAVRKEKLNCLIKLGFDPYPSQTKRSHTINEAVSKFEALCESKAKISITGRIISLRLHGQSLFAHLADDTGKIQIYLKKDKFLELFKIFVDYIDIGDFLGVSGRLFTTKKGEKTLLAENFQILAKALRPLPEKWHGLTDTEIRYRKRYLDLIANLDVKMIFKKRSMVVKAIREFLDNHGFLEVDTPILQPIPGGANARPFVTHHNALDIDLYLRIAPELYLKRLIIGGFDKVYEVSRCFRNEGIDFAHNPEFTQVEFYWAYADYQALMKFTEKFLVYILSKQDKDLIIKYGPHELDFNPPYQRITFHDALLKFAKLDLDKISDLDFLKKQAVKRGVAVERGYHRAKILDELYKKLVRPHLIQPTFLTDHPVELSPLTKRKTSNPNYTERFQFIAAGLELINAFSELNDPQDQLTRFKEQEKLRKMGDFEAQPIDQDFIEALEYGMPPCAGFGLGIDRLAALITNTHNIKEVIFFPTLKPKS